MSGLRLELPWQELGCRAHITYNVPPPKSRTGPIKSFQPDQIADSHTPCELGATAREHYYRSGPMLLIFPEPECMEKTNMTIRYTQTRGGDILFSFNFSIELRNPSPLQSTAPLSPSDSAPGDLSRRPPTPKVAPPSPVHGGSGVFNGDEARGRAKTADGGLRQRDRVAMTSNHKVGCLEGSAP